MPLPVVAEGDKSTSKEKIHILEDSVVTWSRQIKSVLMADPDAALKVGTIAKRNPSRQRGLRRIRRRQVR